MWSLSIATKWSWTIKKTTELRKFCVFFIHLKKAHIKFLFQLHWHSNHHEQYHCQFLHYEDLQKNHSLLNISYVKLNRRSQFSLFDLSNMHSRTVYLPFVISKTCSVTTLVLLSTVLYFFFFSGKSFSVSQIFIKFLSCISASIRQDHICFLSKLRYYVILFYFVYKIALESILPHRI